MRTSDIEGHPMMLNTEQAGELLGITRRQIQYLAQSGKLPAVKIGHQWRFPTQKLLAFAGIESEKAHHE